MGTAARRGSSDDEAAAKPARRIPGSPSSAARAGVERRGSFDRRDRYVACVLLIEIAQDCRVSSSFLTI